MNIIEPLKQLAVPIDSVYPDHENANTDHDIDGIAQSLKDLGQDEPIVCRQADRVICSGNGRLIAAKKLGWTHIAAVFVDDDKAAFIKRAVAHNLLNRKSHFDDSVLKSLLASLDEPLEVPGIDQEFLDSLDAIANASANHGDTGSDADTEPQVNIADELAKEWGVELGQLWQLGNHRILCGDSTKPADVERVLGGVKPLLMVTDPPYGVVYDADWRNNALRADGSASNGRAIGKVLNDDKADWREAWALFPGDVAYVWHAGNKAHVVAESLISCGLEIIAQIIWAKNQLVIGRGNYHPKHEPCWYAVRKGGKRNFTDDRTQTTLWEIDKPQKSETGHSTQKPLECMARAIRNHDSEYVYEPFSGSGTTIIACEQLNRKCLAIELNPGYVAVALQRWADHTGKTPVLIV